MSDVDKSSSTVLDEIKDKFVGKWKLDRSEYFEEFLRECGVNYFARKMANMAHPVSEISVTDEGKVKITMKTVMMTQEDVITFGEEFEKDMQGNKMRGIPTFEDGKIKITFTSKDEGSSTKSQVSTREIIGDELVMTLTIGNVVCKRYMKKLPAES